MLDFVGSRGVATNRKLRLFGVACCRQYRHLLQASRCWAAVELAERYADGLAAAEELRAVADPAWADRSDVHSFSDWQIYAGRAVHSLIAPALLSDELRDLLANLRAAAYSYPFGGDFWLPARAERRQAALHREFFGPDLVFGAKIEVVARSATRQIAEAVYRDRDARDGRFDRQQLNALSDALEEQGDTDPEAVAHLREKGPHVRGCWVVDRILGCR